MRGGTRTIIGMAVAVGALTAAVTAGAQHAGHGAPKPETSGAKTDVAAAPGDRRMTMDELHRQGGVPRGWTFTLPAGGDPAKGRQVFANLECYKCHAIQGAGFPATGGDGKTGPELTGMGAHHPAEYFAESIIAPNNVLLDGPGYIGPDGRSIMPSYADSLTVTELLDLVAFIKSQDGGGHAHHAPAPAQERAAGPYRVRLVFHPHRGHHRHASDARQGDDGGQGGHARHATETPRAAAGHLMAFVTDAATSEAVPYLPITAGVHVQGAPTRTVKLTPMIGRSGFHYGADVALPPGTQRIVLFIGASSLHVMDENPARFTRRQSAAFDWSATAR